LATGIWPWFQVVGFQVAAVAVWQLMQFTPVGKWLAGLPVAAAPLWQDTQLVLALYSAWFGRAPSQVDVLVWQLSQLPVTVVCTAVEGLPVAP
jgi:hypothetical protein